MHGDSSTLTRSAASCGLRDYENGQYARRIGVFSDIEIVEDDEAIVEIAVEYFELDARPATRSRPRHVAQAPL